MSRVHWCMTLTDLRLMEFMVLTGFMVLTEKRAMTLYSVNNRHEFTGMHDLNGNFPYDGFLRRTHARQYFYPF